VDLTEPASVVLPPSTAALLRVLAGADDAFTGRQLARLAGVSHAHAAKVIDRLAEHGLLLVQQRGPSKLCRLNRVHLAAGPLIELVQMRARLLKLLAAAIGAWPCPPVHASLFGSAARGDGTTASDLDILIIRPSDLDADDQQWASQLLDTAARIRQATGNDVAWFDITSDDLRRAVQAEETIITEWRRDALHLCGESLRTVLRKVS
jgi:Nucleotidyltransferase domain